MHLIGCATLVTGFKWPQSRLDRVRWSFKWLQSGQEEEEARGGGKYLGWFVGQPHQQTWTGLSTFEQQTVGLVYCTHLTHTRSIERISRQGQNHNGSH